MKKIILLVLMSVLAVYLISCKKSEVNNSAVENSTVTEFEKEIVITKSSVNESGQKKIDFDWSKLNYNMLSSLIYNIQINPEKYINKRVKVSGNYHSSIYEGKRYYSVLIWDPTGCCPTGFDFIPPVHMKFPDDFPEPDENITVTGIFKFLKENGQNYFIFQAEDIVRENK